MPFFHLNSHKDSLRCPYEGCEKGFEKPTLLMDSTNILRESHYACPHCMSKLEMEIGGMKIIGVSQLNILKFLNHLPNALTILV